MQITAQEYHMQQLISSIPGRVKKKRKKSDTCCFPGERSPFKI